MGNLELYQDIIDGLRLSDIAVKYGCSETTIWRRCKQFNLNIPRRKHNLLNEKFGRLLVISEDQSGKNGSWLCKCECGNEKVIKADHLINGNTRSCGCLARDLKWKGHGKISGNYWNQIKRHAKEKNREFLITIGDAWCKFLEQEERCVLTGLPLTFYTNSKDKSQNQTASLDRIDSMQGYIKNNIQWVHKTIQKMKMNLKETEFIKFCNFVSEHKNENELR